MALNAGAPELAAAATGPLHKADLLDPSAAALLSSLAIPDLLHVDALQKSLTLREARLVYEGAGTAIATLVGIARRFVWRDQVAAQGLSRDGRAKAHVQELVTRMLQTLGLLLACPFYVFEGPERRMAIREAAQR